MDSKKPSSSGATDVSSPDGKEMRNWVKVSDKVSKKDMEKNDMSIVKGGEIDIDRQKEIYLGGDNDVLEGFYESDDEIDFDNLNKNSKKDKKQSGGLFSKLTNAF